MVKIFIPWRVKNYFSRKIPVLYYIINNLISRSNANSNWDQLLCDSWDDLNRTWPQRTQDIIELTDKKNSILDIGCGTGSILRTLKNNGYTSLYGLEHSMASVTRLENYGITMRQGDLPKINFDTNSFDVVIASEVLEHIIFHKYLIKEIIRVLKPGGKAFIYVPNDCMGPIDEPSHVRTYSIKSLANILSKYGTLESISETREKHFPASFLFAKLCKDNCN